MLVFILKSTIFLCVVYLLYMIFLTKENMPVFKRFYLLFGILFSVVIPFIGFDVGTSISETIIPIAVSRQIEQIYTEAEIIQDQHEHPFYMEWIIAVVYVAVSFILLIRYVTNIIRLIWLKRNKREYIFEGCQVALIDRPSTPYSFINTIYINREDYVNGTIGKEIMLHEVAHIRQRHSVDILLVELWLVAFWFNPLLWLYKREIRLNHEYLADRQVIDSEVDVHEYQNIMLNTVFRNNSSTLVSGYDSLFIKKRLIMLTRGKSLFRIWSKKIVLVLLISLFSIAIASDNKHISDMEAGAKLWSPVMRQHGFGFRVYNTWNNFFEAGKGDFFIGNDISALNDAVVYHVDKDALMVIEVDAAQTDSVMHYKLASDTVFLTDRASRITVYKAGENGNMERTTFNRNMPTKFYVVQIPDSLQFVKAPVSINNLEGGIK